MAEINVPLVITVGDPDDTGACRVALAGRTIDWRFASPGFADQDRQSMADEAVDALVSAVRDTLEGSN